MLLFLLIFCSYYVLLSCDDIDNAKSSFNESLLLHKHRQNLLEVNDLLRDLEIKTKELSVLLEAEYQNDVEREKFIYENITNGFKSEISEKNRNNKTENLTNSSVVDVFHLSAKYDTINRRPGLSSIIPGSQRLPVIPQLSTQIGQAISQSDLRDLPSLGHVLKPMHPIYPGLQSQLLIEKGRVFSRPISIEEQAPHYMPKTSSTVKRLSSKKRIVYKESPFSYRIRHIDPLNYKVFRPLLETDPSDPQNLKTHPPDSTIPLTMKTTTIGQQAKIWLQEIAPYTRRRRRRKRVSKDQTRPYHERPTVPKSLLIPESKKYWFSTGTASTAQLFKEDEHGSLQETVGRPVQIPEDPHENWMTTTTRDVLLATIKEQSSTTLSPDQRYQELMKQLGEGYLMVFIIELFRLIAVKDKCEVREVLAHVDTIYNNWLTSGRLSWLKDPLKTVIGNLTAMTSEDNNTDLVRSVSTVMFHSVLERKQWQSPEQSSMIDLAESFYGDADGRRLLCSLKQFEEYPNTTKSSYQICESLIESFLQPLRPPADTRRREQLLSSVTSVLKQRFPHLFVNTKIGRSHERGRSMIATTIRKGKHHHHKKKRKRRKRRLKPEYYNKPH